MTGIPLRIGLKKRWNTINVAYRNEFLCFPEIFREFLTSLTGVNYYSIGT